MVRDLWTRLIAWCKYFIDEDFEYDRASCLILGSQKKVLNNVFLLCKYFIHVRRLFGGLLTYENLLHNIKVAKNRDRNAFENLSYLNRRGFFVIWGHIPNHAFV